MKAMIEIELPNGNKMNWPIGVTSAQIAAAISKSLAKKAVAGMLNGQLMDLSAPIDQSGKIQIITEDDDQHGLSIFRHSAAHLMAQALKRLYPEIKLGIGPVIENGFYYDFDTSTAISSSDLPRIEEEMHKIVAENIKIQRRPVTKEEAIRVFEQLGNDLKLELIESLPKDEQITLYEQG